MKNSIRIFTFLSLVLFALNLNSQSIIKGGLNLSTMLEKDNDHTYSNDYKMQPGFHLGTCFDISLNHFLSLEPGVLFTTRGMRYEESYMGADLEAVANLYYIDIPLRLKAKHDLGGGLAMYAAVGPYAGIGISGKVKVAIEYQGLEESEEEDVDWGKEGDLRSLDLGMSFGGGLEINSFLLEISYDLGLRNIAPDYSNGTTSANRVLKFSVGYIIRNAR